MSYQKLSSESIHEIISSTESPEVLARHYRVSLSTVQKYKRNRNVPKKVKPVKASDYSDKLAVINKWLYGARC